MPKNALIAFDPLMFAIAESAQFELSVASLLASKSGSDVPWEGGRV